MSKSNIITSRLNHIVVDIAKHKRMANMLRRKGALKNEVKFHESEVRRLKREFVKVEREVYDKQVELEQRIEQQQNTLKALLDTLNYARKELGYE